MEEKGKRTNHDLLRVCVAGAIAIGAVIAVRSGTRPPVVPEAQAHAPPGGGDAPTVCASRPGIFRCGTECLNTAETQDHCGECGFRCGANTSCVNGRCVTPEDPVLRARLEASRTALRNFAGGSVSVGTWASLGPPGGGRIDGIVANNADENDLTIAAPGGGVWRTTNNGTSWSQPLNYGNGDYTSLRLERDRINGAQMFVVTPMTVYSTTDNGDHWSNIGGFSMPAPLRIPGTPFMTDEAPFAQLRFSSTDRTLLWGRTRSGILYSTSGTSFTQMWPFSGGADNPRNSLNAIGFDEGTRYVYIVTGKDAPLSGAPAVYQSTCAWTATGPCCTTPDTCWNLVNGGLQTSNTTSEIPYTGVSGWMATATNNGDSSRVYNRSGSTNWAATANFLRPDGGQADSWDPRPLAYLGGDHLVLGSWLPYISPNLGASWTELSINSIHGDARSFYFSSALSRLWVTTDGAGPVSNMHNIVRWNLAVGGAPSSGTAIPVAGSSGLPLWQPYFVGLIERSGSTRLFLGLQDNGSACSDDDGSTWATAPVPEGDTYAFVRARTSSGLADIAYVMGNSTKLYRYNNVGSASSCYYPTLQRDSAYVSGLTSPWWQRDLLAVHPTDPTRVYIAMTRAVDRVVFPSTYPAMGTVTHVPGGDLPGSPAPMITTLSTDSIGNLYVGTEHGGAFVSSDDGSTWSAWGPTWSTNPDAILRIAFSTASGGTAWLASTSGLYRKVGTGAWSVVVGGGGYTVNDIVVDPTCPTRVYCALGFSVLRAYHRGGIDVTEDNGATWSNLTAGLALHQAPIADIEVHPSDSRYLYAAVYGQGIWKLDRGSTPTCP